MASLAMQPVVISETGRRDNNEDSAFASSRLVAVADGVGGATAGEVASALAIQKMIALDKRRLIHSLEQELGDAVLDANALIEFAVFYDAAHAGMGSTLSTVALSNDGDYVIANVGDSRVYLLRDRVLSRLTRDDSLVQELIDRGVLDQDQARRHPQRSVVLAALDGRELAAPAIKKVQARVGDRLLLCSDGVSDYVTDNQIATILQTVDPRAAAEALVHAALGQNGTDNITAIVTDVVPRRERREGWLASLPAPGIGRS
jgi:serine/threonine protein phosphatase PrpC